jgi:rhodanese-related sulfurtransferase
MEGKDKAQPVYIYCARGGRSKSAAAKLSAAGYKIYELQGGFDEWKTAQLPQMK